MKPCVFLGPSLPLDQARKQLDAIYLPPVAQGEVAALVANQRPRVIGIIDGYFEGVAPVWHKEILLALSAGIHVVGGSSMGALRAAELHSMGMVGVGEVFAWYRDGIIDADDEVALRHAPAEHGYRPLSEALVNIRATLRQAVMQGAIATDTEAALIELAARMHYPERSYRSILSRAQALGVARSELYALEAFVAEHRVDQKKLDAIATLHVVATLSSSPERHVPVVELAQTTYLHNLLDRDQPLPTKGGRPITNEHVVNHARLNHPRFEQLKQALVDENIILRCARALGVRIELSELQTGLDAFRRARGLETKADTLAWLAGNRMRLEQLAELVERRMLIEKVRGLHAKLDCRTILDRLRWDGDYPAVELGTLATEQAAFEASLDDEPSEQALLDSYRAQGNRSTPADLDDLMRELGFADRVGLVVELRKLYASKRRARAARKHETASSRP